MTEVFNNSSRLVLGTSQIGSNYGVTNNNFIDEEAAIKILNLCYKNNIREIDTAIDYNNSEKILGNIGVSKFSISTKLPSINKQTENIEKWIYNEVENSLKRLKLSSINTLYLHNPKDLFNEDGKNIYEVLKKLKSEKIISNIGISVYTPDTLLNLIKNFQIDTVQFPLNIMDNRFNTKLIKDTIERQSIRIYIRSIFLQGLLLTNSAIHHNYFKRWRVHFLTWEKWLEENKVSPLDACLNYATSVFSDSRVIVGVSSLSEISEICSVPTKKIPTIPNQLNFNEPELVDPRKWTLE